MPFKLSRIIWIKYILKGIVDAPFPSLKKCLIWICINRDSSLNKNNFVLYVMERKFK